MRSLKNKKLWLGVLLFIFFLYSYIDIGLFLEEFVFDPHPENDGKLVLYIILHIFESLQEGIKQVIDFLLSWKGIALLVIYFTQKNVSRVINLKSD